MRQPGDIETAAAPICARHADRTAEIVCARCGSFACWECRRSDETGAHYCLNCVPEPLVRAERSTRFFANLADSAVLFVPALVVVGAGRGGSGAGEALAGGLIVLLMLGVLATQIYFSARHAQSIGKRLLRIRVARPDGSNASLGRIILLRNAVPMMIGAVPVLGTIFGLADSLFIFGVDRRCIHDHIADTIVVVVPRTDVH